MNVASLELCKELYASSGWGRMDNHTSTDGYYLYKEVVGWDHFGSAGMLHSALSREYGVPAYDLGYLLRKLPQNTGRITLKHREHSGQWYCKFDIRTQEIGASAETPENAGCKLLIEMFKQGILAPTGGQSSD